mgnify:CR=1 FL=1
MSANRQNPLIEIHKGEISVALHLSKGRFDRARKRNAVYRKLGEEDHYHNDFIGLCAEMAWCKHTGVYPDQVFSEEVTPKSKGQDLGDADYKGLRIDVKSTVHREGVIWIDQPNKNVDYYALVLVYLPENDEDVICEIAGIISADNLHSKEPRYRKNFKFPCRWAEQEELLTWDEFSDGTA